ncbi:MAG: hypothetical protein ACYSWZ_00615 [Planctomycetota bacterium]
MSRRNLEKAHEYCIDKLNPRRKAFYQRRYEVTEAWRLKMDKEKNEQNPKAPFVLVQEIFDERSYLWSDTKGLFLYSTKDRCSAVAKDLAAHART